MKGENFFLFNTAVWQSKLECLAMVIFMKYITEKRHKFQEQKHSSLIF